MKKSTFHAQFTIALSSCSVSRTTLEQVGAIALLYKAFEMGRLQRYLRGLQRLLSAGALHIMPTFVIMSALTNFEIPVESSCLQGKVVAYISKPFHIDHLLAAIQQGCAG